MEWRLIYGNELKGRHQKMPFALEMVASRLQL